MICSQNSTGIGHALHPGGQVGGVANGRVIHAQIIPYGAHNHQARVEPYSHLEVRPVGFLYLFTVISHGFLNG